MATLIYAESESFSLGSVMTDQATDAVLFFEDDAIGKAMLLAEFEAVLDHVVAVPEYAEQEAKAVLVRVNPHLDVTAAVFFRLKFNSKGVADASWNLPLDHLAAHSAPGPDMGSGKIRLGCMSQCCVPWHQKQLWDPVMRPNNNSFVTIRRAVKQNSLGLPFRVKPVVKAQVAAPSRPVVQQRNPAPAKLERRRADQAQRDRVALLIKQQRLHIATLNNQRKEEVQRLQVALHKKSTAYEKQLAEQKDAVAKQAERARQFQQSLDEQAKQAASDRKQFVAELQQVQQGDTDQLSVMRENFEREHKAKLDAHTAELKEMLEMREVELYYREEQLGSLRDEIGNLRQERLRLLNQGSSNHLERLKDAGITFVAHHPGAGHITVPLEDMGRYLDAPLAYAAEKCFVEQEHYLQWLQHYKEPTCQADSDDGNCCAAALERVDIPNQFVAAYSDRCLNHREYVELPALRKSQ
ncbi:MAG: chromosome partitioning protein ParA [Pseudomonadales bacterium]